MAIEKVKRVEIIGLAKHRQKTLDYLHQLGVMHLSSQESAKNTHELPRAQALDRLSEVARLLLTIKGYDEILSPFQKKVKVFSQQQTYAQAKQSVESVKEKLSFVPELAKERTELLEEITRLDKKRELLEPLPFDISKDMLSAKFSKTLLFEGEHEDLPGTKIIEFDYTLLQCSQAQYIKHEKLYASRNPLDLSVIEESISLDGIKDRKKYAQDKAQLEAVENQLKDLAVDNLSEVRRLKNEFTMYRERYEKTSFMLATQQTFSLQGYVPVNVLKRLDPPIPLHITELEQEKDIPVKLSHVPYVKHFAFITRMFGLPLYGQIDPTVYLSIFIPLFFGFMFSDIGYGLLVVMISIALLAKSSTDAPVLRNAGVVLAVCGISTMVFGALFGSFFGNLFGLTPLLFDPFANAQTILITSLVVGLVHINLGLALALRKNTIGVLSIWLLQLGGAALFLGLGSISWIILGASFALFIYKSKLMGLMEITGFIGTWFSYARLLALALATGGIALGINIIGNLVGGLPYVGTVLLIFVLIVGHLFNFALNILGSSIHSVRLHYIEFFSQFYEAGGKPFVAFTTKKVQEEL
jgi:vacuolar-type H+-ATPase subunit I/STV1